MTSVLFVPLGTVGDPVHTVSLTAITNRDHRSREASRASPSFGPSSVGPDHRRSHPLVAPPPLRAAPHPAGAARPLRARRRAHDDGGGAGPGDPGHLRRREHVARGGTRLLLDG